MQQLYCAPSRRPAFPRQPMPLGRHFRGFVPFLAAGGVSGAERGGHQRQHQSSRQQPGEPGRAGARGRRRSAGARGVEDARGPAVPAGPAAALRRHLQRSQAVQHRREVSRPVATPHAAIRIRSALVSCCPCNGLWTGFLHTPVG